MEKGPRTCPIKKLLLLQFLLKSSLAMHFAGMMVQAVAAVVVRGGGSRFVEIFISVHLYDLLLLLLLLLSLCFNLKSTALSFCAGSAIISRKVRSIKSPAGVEVFLKAFNLSSSLFHCIGSIG